MRNIYVDIKYGIIFLIYMSPYFEQFVAYHFLF